MIQGVEWSGVEWELEWRQGRQAGGQAGGQAVSHLAAAAVVESNANL